MEELFRGVKALGLVLAWPLSTALLVYLSHSVVLGLVWFLFMFVVVAFACVWMEIRPLVNWRYG